MFYAPDNDATSAPTYAFHWPHSWATFSAGLNTEGAPGNQHASSTDIQYFSKIRYTK
jgi:hypothetical protein